MNTNNMAGFDDEQLAEIDPGSNGRSVEVIVRHLDLGVAIGDWRSSARSRKGVLGLPSGSVPLPLLGSWRR